MVKVITIMDDVYTELYRLKRAKGMSFTKVLRFLLKERSREGRNIINLAGSVNEEDIDAPTAERIKKGVFGRKRYV